MRVLVCGGRDYQNGGKVFQSIEYYTIGGDPVTIISGMATGVDTLAVLYAAKHKLELDSYPILSEEWDKYGKLGGHVRNQRMLDEGKPDLVLAFHGARKSPTGTENMVKIARMAGIKVVEFRDA